MILSLETALFCYEEPVLRFNCALKEIAILERAGLALIGIDHEVLGRRRALGDEPPLDARRGSCPPEPAQVGFLHLFGDGCRLHRERLAEGGISAGGAIPLEVMRVGEMEVPREDLLGRGHRSAPRISSTLPEVRRPS